MVFVICNFFCVVLVTENLHYLIEGNRLKGLDNLYSLSFGKTGCLLFDPFEEISCDAPYIDFLESFCFFFPFRISHVAPPVIRYLFFLLKLYRLQHWL